jgi:HlyD family secretion protein
MFPELRTSILEFSSSDEISNAISTETRLFDLRREARSGQKAQLRERISQLKEEIVGYEGQTTAKLSEVELINQELEGLRELRDKNLVPLSRMIALEREAVRLGGERSQLIAAIAQAKGKIAEIALHGPS